MRPRLPSWTKSSRSREVLWRYVLAMEMTRRKWAFIIASRADLSSHRALPISLAAARNSGAGKPTRCSIADSSLRKSPKWSGFDNRRLAKLNTRCGNVAEAFEVG